LIFCSEQGGARSPSLIDDQVGHVRDYVVQMISDRHRTRELRTRRSKSAKAGLRRSGRFRRCIPGLRDRRIWGRRSGARRGETGAVCRAPTRMARQ
jgi:hypothetical protein